MFIIDIFLGIDFEIDTLRVTRVHLYGRGNKGWPAAPLSSSLDNEDITIENSAVAYRHFIFNDMLLFMY